MPVFSSGGCYVPPLFGPCLSAKHGLRNENSHAPSPHIPHSASLAPASTTKAPAACSAAACSLRKVCKASHTLLQHQVPASWLKLQTVFLLIPTFAKRRSSEGVLCALVDAHPTHTSSATSHGCQIDFDAGCLATARLHALGLSKPLDASRPSSVDALTLHELTSAGRLQLLGNERICLVLCRALKAWVRPQCRACAATCHIVAHSQGSRLAI